VKAKSRLTFCIALLAVVGYWWFVRPPGLSRIGYSQNLAETELTRQIVADDLANHDGFRFFTTRVMAPAGVNAAYFPWSLERDWLGGWFWIWNRDFPFLWVYFGASLLISYIAIGWLSQNIGVPARFAWMLAAIVVIFNVPRHHKIYHHYAQITQHWVDVSFFLDAWIWARFVRERRWSLSLEIWRLAALIAVFWMGGIFWGPLLAEWFVVRLSLLVGAIVRRRNGTPIVVERRIPSLAVPAAIVVALGLLSLEWFIPLMRQAMVLGEVPQPITGTAPLWMVWRPLWLEWFLLPFTNVTDWSFRGLGDALRHTGLPALGAYETVVSVGWVYWLPFAASLWVTRRNAGGPGWVILAPFLFVLACAIGFLSWNEPYAFQRLIQHIVPFMTFFRVPTRMALFFGSLLASQVALAWPDLMRFGRQYAASPQRARWLRVALGAYLMSSAVEAGRLTVPIIAMPSMDASMTELLHAVRSDPGTTVLNLPFCLASGADGCDGTCPQYPLSTAGMYLTGYHDKRVFGAYLSRLVESQCRVYEGPPYRSWFDAWAADRCFTNGEWTDFCGFLEAHHEIGDVIVFADLWRAADNMSCRRALESRLGSPRSESSLVTRATHGALRTDVTRVRVYGARCRAASR